MLESPAVGEAFRAFVARTTDAGTRGAVDEVTLDALPAGDVTIAVEYSSLNYKDALAATGQNKVAASYPHVPGIDAAGTVAASTDPGVDAGHARARHRLRLRRAAVGRLGPLRARAVGLGGADPRRAVDVRGDGDRHRRFHRGARASRRSPATARRPTAARSSSPARPAASAASPSTCSPAPAIASSAVTGKADQHDWLRTLGASEILPREAVSLANDAKPRPLLPARWAGALDNVGGATLEALVRGTQTGGNVALCGLVGGADYRGTVMPFILRGVGLLGITSSNTPMPVREHLWQRLATDLRPRHLADIARTVALDALPGRDRSHARRPGLRPRRGATRMTPLA